MLKRDYMAQLERWARWMLPRQEAEDVIADYRDIVGVPPRPEEELLRDLGRPRDVVKPLVQPKPYRNWLAAFAAMAACILLPALGPWPCMGLYLPHMFGNFFIDQLFFKPLWLFFFGNGVPMYWLAFLLGVILPLAWFRRRDGGPKAPLPRPIPIAMAALLAVMAGPWWLLCQFNGCPSSFIWQHPHIPGPLIAGLLEWFGLAAALAGAAALVKARICDRRWRAVYVLALTAVMLCLSALAILTNMELSGTPGSHPFQAEVTSALILTAIGLIGTGAALC